MDTDRGEKDCSAILRAELRPEGRSRRGKAFQNPHRGRKPAHPEAKCDSDRVGGDGTVPGAMRSGNEVSGLRRFFAAARLMASPFSRWRPAVRHYRRRELQAILPATGTNAQPTPEWRFALCAGRHDQCQRAARICLLRARLVLKPSGIPGVGRGAGAARRRD